MKKYFLLQIILLFVLILSGCGSEKSDKEKITSDEHNSKIEQKQSICKIIEEDAFNAEKAIRNYFSNPFNDKIPQLSDLKDFSSDNLISIEGNIDQIIIIVKSKSEVCDKGKKFIISIPPGEKDGWQ